MDNLLLYQGTALLLFIGLVTTILLYEMKYNPKNWAMPVPQIKFYPRSDDSELFNNVLNDIETLSSDERDVVIQRIYGRPCKITRGFGNDGTSWIEYVVPFSENTELAFHDEKAGKPSFVG